jgi:hypothetical protein
MNTYHRLVASVTLVAFFFLPISPVLALGVDATVTPSPVVVVTPPVDTTAPVISGVATSSVLPTSATLVWTTDELSVSTFAYGTTQSLGSSAALSASAALGGTVTLTGLTPSTIYYFCIRATDSSSNVSQLCADFSTVALPDATAPLDTTTPVIADVAALSLEPTTTTISWVTNELATASIECGPTPGIRSRPCLGCNSRLSAFPFTPFRYTALTYGKNNLCLW